MARDELPTPSLAFPFAAKSLTTVAAASSVCNWVVSRSLSGSTRLAPQLGQDVWTLTLGLDSRDCPSQWTCIFPLVLFLNPAVLPADYKPHPCPHPSLWLTHWCSNISMTLLLLPAARPTTLLFMSLAPHLSLEQPERSEDLSYPPYLASNPQLSHKNVCYSHNKKSATDNWVLRKDLRLLQLLLPWWGCVGSVCSIQNEQSF